MLSRGCRTATPFYFNHLVVTLRREIETETLRALCRTKRRRVENGREREEKRGKHWDRVSRRWLGGKEFCGSPWKDSFIRGRHPSSLGLALFRAVFFLASFNADSRGDAFSRGWWKRKDRKVVAVEDEKTPAFPPSRPFDALWLVVLRCVLLSVSPYSWASLPLAFFSTCWWKK